MCYPQITQITQNLCNLWMALEVQLNAELELPRVEGRGWAAVVAAIAGALVEGAHVVDKGLRRSFVEAIEKIEAFRDQLQSKPLTQRNQSRQTQIQRHVAMRQTEVACQTSTRKHASSDQTYTTRCARNA